MGRKLATLRQDQMATAAADQVEPGGFVWFSSMQLQPEETFGFWIWGFLTIKGTIWGSPLQRL